MSELSQFVGEDSRKPIQRLKRAQLHKVANERGLQYPNGASKEVMIKLFEANDIDVTQSPEVQWQVINGRDIDGNLRQEVYPVEQQPASVRNGVNASAVLNERLSAKAEEEKDFAGARMDALERENTQLRRTNEQLTDAFEKRMAALESDHKKPVDQDLPQSKYWAIYRKARDAGLKVDRNMKQPQIEALIEQASADG